jgi:hypothetical protein
MLCAFSSEASLSFETLSLTQKDLSDIFLRGSSVFLASSRRFMQALAFTLLATSSFDREGCAAMVARD